MVRDKWIRVAGWGSGEGGGRWNEEAGRVNRRTWGWLEWLSGQELENAGEDMTGRSQPWSRNELLGKLVCDGSRTGGVQGIRWRSWYFIIGRKGP